MTYEWLFSRKRPQQDYMLGIEVANLKARLDVMDAKMDASTAFTNALLDKLGLQAEITKPVESKWNFKNKKK